ncbi:MAG: nitronate monooxygenase [Burkholderiaceae bacterium]|nr:nitronate monooxygenase [Burkholderiaceae bacterium]
MDFAYVDPALAAQFARSGLRPLVLRGRALLPIVQGGMGIGVSAHRLAGSVAALGGVGTLSSVDLRRHHPDLMERTRALASRAGCDADSKAQIDAANLEALRREVAAARERSRGRGLLAMNVMRAVSDYAAYVRTSLEAGIDAVVVGAGLPLDLPDLAAEHPQALLVPILSDARGVALVIKKWERKKRLPDAIVIEHPKYAGGHLGAAKIADLGDERFEFERVLAQARDEDVVEFTSVAGLPARAVATPWLKAYLKLEPKLQAVAHAKARCTKAFDCLAQCGLRDGLPGWGQFCIDNQLAAAMRGDVKKGLFFRGAGSLPFGDQIRPVRELVERLLQPAPAAAMSL